MLKTTLNFLTSLKANNNRDWFTDNKSEYLEAKSQFEAFVGKLIIGIKEFDSTIGSIEPKDCVFRIYRDVRFSHNKEPYKTNMGGLHYQGRTKGFLCRILLPYRARRLICIGRNLHGTTSSNEGDKGGYGYLFR